MSDLKYRKLPTGTTETSLNPVMIPNIATNGRVFDGIVPPLSPSDKGFPGDATLNYHWEEHSDEPHATRRKIILAKYPEIKQLMGPCPWTKYSVAFMVTLQFILAYIMKDQMWTAQFWIVAYVFGATINHSLFLAIHEITHFLAFEKPLHNRLLACFANLPIGIAYMAAFRGYHMEHHSFQGVQGIDTDLPTELEAKLLQSTLGKLFFCIFQILFYAFRPMLIKPQKFTDWHLYNWIFQVGVMGIMIYFWGWNSFFYLLTCSLLAGALHPMSGHFIAEHYVFVKGYETYSYYGPLNLLAFNVGYHNEHHDFPRIPGSRLPLVRKIASEFYDTLPQHKSWTKVIFDFIFLHHMTPYSRVLRSSKRNNPEKYKPDGLDAQ